MNKLLFMAAIAIIAGCSANHALPGLNSISNKPAIPVNPFDIENQVTFRVNGEKVSTGVWSISRFKLGNDSATTFMNITSNMHDDTRTLNVNLNGAVAGKYLLTEAAAMQKKSYGSFYPDYIRDPMDGYFFTSGVCTITEVDTIDQRVSGHFYGRVKNLHGDSMEITEGRINRGIMNVDITSY